MRCERWTLDLSASPEMTKAMAEGKDRQGPYWAEPVWSPEGKTTLLTLRMPVRRDDRFLGLMIVAVALGDLSRFLSELYVDEGLSAFVLYDRDHVLAHQALRYKEFNFSEQAGLPLPRVDQVDDPVLANLWRNSRPADRFTITGRNRTNAEVVEIGDDSHLFLLRSLEGYGAQPWTVGINYRLDEVGVEIERLWTTALVGFGILLVSVGTALWIGRAISRQIGRLAAAAASVSALDFKGAPTLPDSRFRELANAADAFNAMVAGLRWFETYVPKGLVLRLIRRDASDKTGARHRLGRAAGDGDVHRHPGLQRAGGGSGCGGDRGPAEQPLLPAVRLHRGGRRHGGQVHRRRRHGFLGSAGDPAGPRGAGLAGGACDRGRRYGQTTSSAAPSDCRRSACESACTAARWSSAISARPAGSTTRSSATA